MRVSYLRWRAAAALSGAVLVAATSACSSSGSTSSSSGSSASGESYKIMVIGPVTSGSGVQSPPQPELVVGAKAAVQAVNKSGGAGGHPLDLEVCDTQGTKNGGVTCATKAVSEHVLAVVGAVDFYGDYISILKSAGVPNVGPLPIQAETQDANSYPIEGGASVVPAAVVSFAARNGATSLAYVGNASAYTSSIPQLTASVVKQHDDFKVNLISIPATAVDVAPYVTQAASSKYIDLATFAPTVTLSFIKGYLAGGGNPGSVLTSASTLTPALIKTLGSAAEGLKVTSLFVPAADPVPAAEQFRNDMNAIDPAAAKDEVSENAYLAVKLFAAAVKDGPVSKGADVATALQKIHNLNLGLVPPISFDRPVSGAPAPRIFNDGVLLAEVKNGVLVSNGNKFFSAYTGKDIAN